MNVDEHLAREYGRDFVSREAAGCLIDSVRAIHRNPTARRHLLQALVAEALLVERQGRDGEVSSLLDALDMVRCVLGFDEAERDAMRREIVREGGAGLIQ